MAVLEQSGRARAALAALVLLVAIAATGTAWFATRDRSAASGAVAQRAVPGEPERIVVEVLNSSPAVGLARAATRRLRDSGLDVVYYGSDTTDALDSTEVLLRRGDSRAAERVARALGAGRVRSAPDPSRLVDVSVRLGRDFARLLRDP